MKKIIIILAILLGAACSALAVPASREKYRRVQPDGSVIVLQNHGDEYCHWTTDESGQVVEKGEDGFYHPVSQEIHKANLRRASALRPRALWSSYETAKETNFGERKVLCIIANFTDSTFVIDNPRERFSNMLNQEGYSANGSIGSVRDYYLDNSLGQYSPQFDVYGPVDLSHTSQYYDTNGTNLAITEAYQMLSSQIPIDDYDTDGDGILDMVLFYYPGHNEAEGAGPESIWPHQRTGNFGYLGGKRLTRYFCTSELRGSSGREMCNIGTTCHEFAHSLGLPDFYDTDYATNGQNKDNSGYYDLMGGGNYLDAGRRPPYLNAMERNMLGWMPNPADIPEGEITLEPIRENLAYKVQASTEGEYYLLECRDVYKWDSGIPLHFPERGGLLVYRVDRTERIVPGSGTTAVKLWDTNKINAYGGYPCFWTVPSNLDASHFMFPGVSNVTNLEIKDWDGNSTGITLKDIRFDGTNLTLNCVRSLPRTISGTVRNSTREALAGAKVYLTTSRYSFRPRRIGVEGELVATTDSNGCYEFTLAEDAGAYQVLTVYKEGYVPVSVNVEVSTFTRYNVILPILYKEDATLQRYDPEKDFYQIRNSVQRIGVAMDFTADEVLSRGAAGTRIDSIGFLAAATQLDKAYLLVCIEGRMPWIKDITGEYVAGEFTYYDITADNVIIPDNAAVYIGYGFDGLDPAENGLIACGPVENSTKKGALLTTDFLAFPINWMQVTFDQQVLDWVISAKTSAVVETDLSAFGAAFIRVVDGEPTIVTPKDRTVYSVEWQNEPHTYVARITYYDGTVERVYLDY